MVIHNPCEKTQNFARGIETFKILLFDCTCLGKNSRSAFHCDLRSPIHCQWGAVWCHSAPGCDLPADPVDIPPVFYRLQLPPTHPFLHSTSNKSTKNQSKSGSELKKHHKKVQGMGTCQPKHNQTGSKMTRYKYSIKHYDFWKKRKFENPFTFRSLECFSHMVTKNCSFFIQICLFVCGGTEKLMKTWYIYSNWAAKSRGVPGVHCVRRGRTSNHRRRTRRGENGWPGVSRHNLPYSTWLTPSLYSP